MDSKQMCADPNNADDPPGLDGHAHDDTEQRVVETDPSNRYVRYNQMLGRGAFKLVYKAFDEIEGMEVAWNQVKVNDMVSSPADRERLFAEIRVLKQLKHKNVMSFVDSWLDKEKLNVNFITELFTSGTLRQYRKKHKHLDEQVLKRWAWQILQGLVYLHGHNPPIIHRDLKCDNIFVNGASGVIKLGDLGLATLWRGMTTPQSVLGTPEFMAPELYEEKYDEKVDVYSFGMCMLELATMEYPYAECKNAAQIYRKVTTGILPGGLDKVENQGLREFIELCISHDPEQRPEARQLLKHNFFESIRTGKTSCPGVDKAICERNNEESSSGDDAYLNDDVDAAAARLMAKQMSAQKRTDKLSLELPAKLVEAADPSAPGSSAAAPQSATGRRPQSSSSGVAMPGSSDEGLYVASSASSILPTPERMPSGPTEEPGRPVSPLPLDLQSQRHSESGTGRNGEFSREFFVSCEQLEETKLRFQLKFNDPGNLACKKIEFAFDTHDDTADAIAGEMMEDLSLSAEEAQCIATKIRMEIRGIYEAKALVEMLWTPGDSLPMSGAVGAAYQAGQPTVTVDRSLETQSLGVRPSANGVAAAGQKSGGLTPTFESGSGKAPSIYALIAAMKEVHKEESLCLPSAPVVK